MEEQNGSSSISNSMVRLSRQLGLLRGLPVHLLLPIQVGGTNVLLGYRDGHLAAVLFSTHNAGQSLSEDGLSVVGLLDDRQCRGVT